MPERNDKDPVPIGTGYRIRLTGLFFLLQKVLFKEIVGKVTCYGMVTKLPGINRLFGMYVISV